MFYGIISSHMVKRKQTIRKCSVCKQPGHTKRSCQGKIEHKTSSRSSEPQTHVFVRTHADNVASSAHVIDLKSEHEGVILKAPVFSEKKVEQPTIRTVDFAAEIRKAKLEERAEVVLPVVARIKKQRPRAFQVKQKPVVVRKEVKKAVVARPPKAPRLQRSRRTMRFTHIHAIAMTCMVVVIVMGSLVVQDVKAKSEKIAHHAAYAYDKLQSSTKAAFVADAHTAAADLADALTAFAQADEIVDQEHTLLQSVVSVLPVVGPQLEGRKQLLQAGQHIALGNSYLIKGVGQLQTDKLSQTDRLQIIGDHLRAAKPQYAEAMQAFASVSPAVIPTNQQQVFDEFRVLFAAFVDDLDELADVMDGLSLMLGSDDFKRYLVVFQNERELRATGGFVGSFAVCDVQKGKFFGCDIPGGGSYDLKGQLSEHVKPPAPLQLVNGRWEFQDANWWSDFEASAKKMMWFYEKSRETTVDGVIAVNGDMLERFLDVVGPIVNEEFSVALNTENALETIQEKVELDYDKEENKPKKIIGSLAEQFVSQLNTLETRDFMKLLAAMHDGANNKDVQLYMRDARVQKRFASFGWTGNILPTQVGQDYLHVVSANIQGQKSDEKIHQDVEHTAYVQPDGTVIAKTTLRKEHTGRPGEQFYGGQNISYVRMYVPEGSVMLEGSGFSYPPEEAFHVPESWYKDDPDIAIHERDEEIHLNTGTRITKQFGKTVFGNWMIAQPGQVEEVSITYQLPFRVALPDGSGKTWYEEVLDHASEGSRYTFVAQSQSGVDADLRVSIYYPDEWTPSWQSDSRIDIDSHAAHLEAVLDQDLIMGVVMQRN